jgi:hypothetical protein
MTEPHDPGFQDSRYRLTPEQARSRRSRNIAIALSVSFMVVLFYVVTVSKLGLGVLNKGW